MVKEQVQKQISELRAEFHLGTLELRQQMEEELRKHRREPKVKEAGAAPQRCTAQDLECTATRQRVEVENNHGDRGKDEELLFSHMSSCNSPEASSHYGFDYVEISEKELSLLSADGHSVSYQTGCGSINNQIFSSEAPSVSDDDPPPVQSEEKDSMVREQKCTQEIAQVRETKLTEAWPMKHEWNKWLDEQERKVKDTNRKPQHEKKTKKLERIDKHAAATRQKKKTGLTDNMKTFGTSVGHLFYPLTSTSYKWEKLEED